MHVSLSVALCVAHGLALTGGAAQAQDTTPPTFEVCPPDVTVEVGGLSPEMTDLGPVDRGLFGWALALNWHGQVAGTYTTAAGESRVFLCSPAAGTAPATRTDLGGLGDGGMQIGGFNASGHVAGFFRNGLSPYQYLHAFLYDPETGMMEDLRTLGGRDSKGLALNEHGQVAGWSDTESGGTHAFLYDPQTGMMEDLGTLGGRDSQGLALNQHGQVAGWSDTESGDRHAFLYTPGLGMEDLGTLGGDMYPLAINDAGQVAGRFVTAGGDTHPFLYTPASENAPATMIDLGTLGGSSIGDLALNGQGQVAGLYATADSETALEFNHFLYTPGIGMVDLGTRMQGRIDHRFQVALNNAGQVLGVDESAGAFLYTPGVGLEALAHFSGAAMALNDRGQIVGTGVTADFASHAFLWDRGARASDGGDPVSISSTDVATPGDCGATQTVERTFIATDPSGNVATCTQTRTFVDTTPPTIDLCPPDTTVEVGATFLADLGTLGGSYSEAAAINDAGQVTGNSVTTGGESHAFLYTPATATMSDLGTLGGYSRAVAINEAGQVTGNSVTTGGEGHAFLYTPATATMSDLGTLGGSGSQAVAINETGQVTGSSSTAAGEVHAFLYTAATATMRDLGTLGGSFSQAVAINEAGQVAGDSSTAAGEVHAFLYTPATATTPATMRDLGTLGGSDSQAVAINEAGQVTGTSSTVAGESHAFRYTPPTATTAATMIDLGHLGGSFSNAIAINNGGQVAGSSSTAAGEVHAFRYDPATATTPATMIDLGHLGGGYSTAATLNERGQVAGNSYTVDSGLRLFLWDPVTGMADLGTFEGDFIQATAMNDAGQIVGAAQGANGQLAFLYDPAVRFGCGPPPPGATGLARATDLSGAPTISFSDSVLADGVLRTWGATDACGNVGVCDQMIRARPRIMAPSGVMVQALGGATLVPVPFSVSVSDSCSETTLDVSPPSGSLFPIGVTPVIVTATDAAGNVSTRTFDVTVTTPPLDVTVDEAVVKFDVTRSQVKASGALGLNGGWVAAHLVRGASGVVAHARLTLAGQVIADEDVELRVRSGGKKWELAASSGATGIKKLSVDWRGAGGEFAIHVPFDAAVLGLTVDAWPRELTLELRLGNAEAIVSGSTLVTTWRVSANKWKLED